MTDKKQDAEDIPVEETSETVADDTEHFPEEAEMPEWKKSARELHSKLDEFGESTGGLLNKYADPNRWFGGLNRRKAVPEGAIRYATFNDRMMASLLDSLLILVMFYPVIWLVPDLNIMNFELSEMLHAISRGADPKALLETPGGQRAVQGFIISNLIQTGIVSAAIIACWMILATTPGKWVLRLRIVNEEDGSIPKRFPLILRFLGYFISPIVGLVAAMFAAPLVGPELALIAFAVVSALGFLWIVFDKKKQAWHDKVAKTAVIKVKHWHIHPKNWTEYPESYFEDDALWEDDVPAPETEEQSGEGESDSAEKPQDDIPSKP